MTLGLQFSLSFQFTKLDNSKAAAHVAVRSSLLATEIKFKRGQPIPPGASACLNVKS